MIKVYTEATCQGCGQVTRVEGADSFCPTIEWARVEIAIRHEGASWTNNTQLKWIL